MNRMPKPRLVRAILFSVMAAGGVHAANIIDLGLSIKDPSICRGPGETYYLTGATLGRVDGKEGFHNCSGARVWSSKDLKEWQDLGYAFDTREFDSEDKDMGSGSRWHVEFYPVPGLTPGERGRGFTAPRLVWDGERFWITHSMNGYAAGALPSEGADVKGPYVRTKLTVEAGGAPTGQSDASMFIDTDGTKYLVWGGGVIAELKSLEEMKNDFGKSKEGKNPIAKDGEGVVGVKGERHFIPALIEKFYTDKSLPEHGAPYGVSIVHAGGKYRFMYTASTFRDGTAHEDSYIATSDKLLGPYGKPQLLFPDSGRVSAFQDAQGKWNLVYCPNNGDKAQITSISDERTWQIESIAKTGGKSSASVKPVKIATKIPVPKPSDKPKDVPQLLEIITPIMDYPLSRLMPPSPPVELRVHAKYNPDAISQYNIVPGLMGVVLTMTMIIITSLAITRERERGTMENLLSTPARPFEVMTGKIVPYIMVGYIQVGLILLAARFIFRVPMTGNILLLLGVAFLFILANLSAGILFSTIAHNQLQAVQMSFFFFLPSLLLSGFMFPFRGMPVWAQWIGEVFPLTHFLRIVRGILLKGNGPIEILPQTWQLAAFMAVVMAIGLKRYRRTLD